MKQQKKTILLVDDNADTGELVTILFKNEGCQVTVCQEAQESIRLAKSRDVVAIVLDYWLPEINGADVCRAIRTFNKDVPIIFYTGEARTSEREKAMAAGANAYLVKPVDLQNLVETVSQFVPQTSCHQTPLRQSHDLEKSYVNRMTMNIN